MPSIGNAWMPIVPALVDGWQKRIASEISRGLGDAGDEGGREGGKRAGRTFAGSFDREVNSGIRKAMAALPDIKIDADTDPARQKVARITAEMRDLESKRIGVDIDAGAAMAKVAQLKERLDAVSSDSTASIDVRADTAVASRALDQVRVSAERLGAVSPTVTVDANTAKARAELRSVGDSGFTAQSGVSGLVAALIAIGPAAVPAAAAAGAALLGLSTTAASAAAGVGVAALAFKGVGEAISALDAAEKSAADDAQAAATKRAAAAQRVAAAQQSAADAQRQAADTAERTSRAVADARNNEASVMAKTAQAISDARANEGEVAQRVARSIQDAERGVAEATQQSARQVESAQQARAQTAERVARQIRDAEQSVSDARAQSAQGIESALARVRSAQEQETVAVRNAREARASLTQAQEEARRSLQQLATQLRAGQLDEEEAVLRVKRAQQALGKKGMSPIDAEQAKIDAERAVMSLDEIRQRNAQLRADKAAADKAGINGSKQVQAAQQRIADAEERRRKASQDVRDAEAGVEKARLDGAARVAAAEEKVRQTRADGAREVAQAERTLQQARADGAARVAQAEEKVRLARTDGAREIAQAEQATARTRADGAQQIAEAHQRVADALRSQVQENARAQESAARAGAAVVAAQKAAASAGNEASASQKKVAEAMSDLTPAGQRFARFIFGLKGSLRDVKAQAEGGLFPGLESGIRSAGQALAPFQGAVRPIAQALGDMAAAAGKALGDPVWQNFFRMIAEKAPSDLRAFGSIMGNIASFAAQMAVEFRPLADSIIGWAKGMADSLGSFDASKSTGLQAFMAYVNENGPKLVDTVGSVISAVGNLLVALAPLGALSLDGIKAVADAIAGMDPQTLRDIAVPLGAIVLAIKGIALGSTALNTTVESVKAIGTAAGSVKTFASALGTDAKLAFAQARSGIASTGSAMAEAGGKARTAAVDVGKFVAAKGRAAATAAGDGIKALGSSIASAGSAARTAAVDVGRFAAAKARATATAAADGIKSIASSLASAGAAARTAAVDLGSAAAAHARAGAAAALSATRTLAARAAQIAAGAAARAMAAGQWLVNAALSANPIGLVIAGLVALGAGLVIAYNKSETFRRIVDAAWAGVKSAALSTVTWFQTTAWPVLQNVFRWIGDKATSLWTGYIQPAFVSILGAGKSAFLWMRDSGWPAVRDAFGWVAGKASWLWTHGMKPHLDNILAGAKVAFLWVRDSGWPAIRDAFGWISGKASWLWTSGVKPHFESLKSGVSAVVTAFTAAKDAIGRTWDGLTSAVSSPITSALNWIKSNFVDKLAGLLDAVGLDSLASKLRGTSLSVSAPRAATPAPRSNYVSRGGRYDFAAATGGVLPGYTPGKDVHHFHSPTAGTLHLSGGEAIMRPEWTRAVGGPAAVAEMNRRATRGQAFAFGGVWQAQSAWIKEHFPDLVITSTTGGGHATRSYHYQGKAVDVGGPLDRLQAAAKAIMSQYGSNIAELILNPGASVKNGHTVDPSMWGAATWANHGGSNLHLHWAMNDMAGGSGIAGFIGGIFSSLKEKAISGLRGAIGALPIPGMFGDVTKSVLSQALTSLVGLADSEAVAGDAGSGLSAGNAKAPAGMERWRNVAAQALQMAGLPSSLLELFLQRGMVESSGNQYAVNRWDSNARAGHPSSGIWQVIQPTFDAYAGPLRSRGIFDPLANGYAAAMYTKAAYPGLDGIRRAWSGTKGYAVGTPSASPGLAWVGERGPELVDFRGGERVYTHEQSRRLVEKPASQVTYVVNATPQRADDIVRAAQEAEYRRRIVHAIY